MASERSEALLIGAERLAEGAGLLLIGQERLAELAAWLLIDAERLSERIAWLLIDAERLSERIAWLLINAERPSDRSAWLLIDAERPPESSEGLPLGTGCLRQPLDGLMVVAAAGLAAADVVQLGAVLYGEQQHQQVAQRGTRLQHAEGVQYVVGAADGRVGRLACIGQLALALSGEVRLRLGIASKLDSALGLH